MLKVCEPSPPVPTMSTRCVRSATSTLVANSRITCAAAVISPMVSFLTRRPISIAAIITGDISPLMMRRISASISSWKISRWSMVRVSASVLVMGMVSSCVGSNEVFAHGGDRRGRCRRASTSRWVTKRRPIQAGGQHAARLQVRQQAGAPARRAGRRTRCWSAAARTVQAGRCRCSPSARRRASAWSSARRSTWWSSACSAAAASTPAWRMPPPSILRQRCARGDQVLASPPAPSRPARPGPC